MLPEGSACTLPGWGYPVSAVCWNTTGIPLAGKAGLWQPYPVEYKRGRPREDTGDALQLCGQAMCLEDMLCCDIPEGALYYGELRRRGEVVCIDWYDCLQFVRGDGLQFQVQ